MEDKLKQFEIFLNAGGKVKFFPGIKKIENLRDVSEGNNLLGIFGNSQICIFSNITECKKIDGHEMIITSREYQVDNQSNKFALTDKKEGDYILRQSAINQGVFYIL